MVYTKPDLVARSGLAMRTIRGYISRGLIPKPKGYGLGATYGEEHMLRAVTIGRMRAQGDSIDVIAGTIEGWSLAKFRRYVRDTEPPAVPEEPQDEGPPEAPPVEALEAGPAPKTGASDLVLSGATIQIVPLLPGLALLLDANASPLVRRVATEIAAQYRVT